MKCCTALFYSNIFYTQFRRAFKENIRCFFFINKIEKLIPNLSVVQHRIYFFNHLLFKLYPHYQNQYK